MSRSLPGFLRRSLRIEFDDDDDDDENEEDGEGIDVNVNVVPQIDHPSAPTSTLSSREQDKNQSSSSNNNNNQNNDHHLANNANLAHKEDKNDTSDKLVGTAKQQQNSPLRNALPRSGMEILSEESERSFEATDLSNPVALSSATAMTTTATSPSKGHSAAVGGNVLPKSSLQMSDSWQERAAVTPTPSVGVTGNMRIPTLPLPISPLPTRPRTYRETQFDKILLQTDVVNMEDLRQISWNGIPSVYRAQAWKILLGYLPTHVARRETALRRKRAEYQDAMRQHYHIDDDARTLQEQETLRQVLVDVPRTAPDVPLFRNERIRRMLTRILYIWAMRHPASSYVQGINDLTTPLMAVFLADYFVEDRTQQHHPHEPSSQQQQQQQLQHSHSTSSLSDDHLSVVLDGHVMNHISDQRLDELEADVYWCLTNLLAGIQDHYTQDQPGVQRMVMKLQELAQRIDADLCRHLEHHGIEFIQFSFKWMNCCLLREFQLPCVFRLWDTYFSESDGFESFHVYVCAAFLCQFSPQLQSLISFDELFGMLQHMPTEDWSVTEIEVLLSQSYVLSTLFRGSDAHLTSGAR